MTAYGIFVFLHSIMRWLVLIFGLFAIIRALTGLSFKRGWMSMDNRAGLLFTSVMDLQLLLGVILYFFLSPLTTAALRNFAGAMANPEMRFFAVEHITLMIIAVVVAHVGRSLAKRAPTAPQKHRRTAIWFAISLLIVLAAIPWPGMAAYARPLL